MGNNQGNTKSNHQDGNKSFGRHDANSSGNPPPAQRAPHDGSDAGGSNGKNRSKESDPKSTSRE